LYIHDVDFPVTALYLIDTKPLVVNTNRACRGCISRIVLLIETTNEIDDTLCHLSDRSGIIDDIVSFLKDVMCHFAH